MEIYEMHRLYTPCLESPCHHSVAHPWVAIGGDSFQICMVAANILNKQTWTASKGWTFSLEVGQGVDVFSP